MKICSNLHWRMKMWRTQISGLLKNEDYQLPHLLKMKIVFLKALKTEDLKTPLKKMCRKWRPCHVQYMSCAGSTIILPVVLDPFVGSVYCYIQRCYIEIHSCDLFKILWGHMRKYDDLLWYLFILRLSCMRLWCQCEVVDSGRH